METPTTAAQTAQAPFPATTLPSPGPVASAPHAYTKGCECAKCAGQRAKWREKDTRRKRKDNPFAAEAAESSPGSRPPLAVLPPVASPGVASPPSKPVVPWTLNLVLPIVTQAAKLIERWDCESLIAEARKISEAAAKFVEANVAWNAEARTMLVEGSAECAVKYLNLSGVSAEYAPEIKTALAALAIIHSRQELVATLKRMQDEAKALNQAKAEEKKAA